MTLVFETLLGSRLYGTQTEDSDTDVLRVVLPSPRAILLGQALFSTHDPDHPDGDVQVHSLGRFLSMLHQATGPSLDAFFAPPCAHNTPEHPLFAQYRPRMRALIRPGVPGVLDFCRSQVKRAGRVANNHAAIAAMLDAAMGAKGPRLDALFEQVDALCKRFPGVITRTTIASQAGMMDHVAVVDRHYPKTLMLKDFQKSMQALATRYGRSASVADTFGTGQRVDMRSLRHALRLAYQARRFVQTGQMLFPLPERDTLIAIKQGAWSPDQVRDTIEGVLNDIHTCPVGEDVPETQVLDLIAEIHTHLIRHPL